MDKTLRIALIGCGRVAKLHVQGWQQSKMPVEIAMLVDVKPELAHKLKDETHLDSAAVTTDYQQALSDPLIDAVEICTYSDLHTGQIIAALEAGKHVMTEKPVGYSLEDCRKLRWYRNQFPVPKVQVAYSLRYYPVNQAIKREIEAGTIGRPMFASVTHNHEMHDDADPFVPSDYVHTDLGGRYIAGSEMTHATHPFDLARWLLGEVVDVFALRSEIGTFATFRHANKVICHVTASRSAKGGLASPLAVCVQGTKGTIFASYLAGKEGWEAGAYRGYLVTQGRQQDITPDQSDTGHGDLGRCRNFYNAVMHDEQPVCDMLDAIRTTELLHAIRDSHDHEIRVPIHQTDQTG